jgi:hypothetical protein
VEIHLTAKGERCIDRLARAHRAELLDGKLMADMESLAS